MVSCKILQSAHTHYFVSVVTVGPDMNLVCLRDSDASYNYVGYTRPLICSRLLGLKHIQNEAAKHLPNNEVAVTWLFFGLNGSPRLSI